MDNANQSGNLDNEGKIPALRAGVVGLGMIGGGVAVSLARRNRIPAVFDIKPDAAATLIGVPSVLSSPCEVASACDVVMVAVANASQAIEVISGPKGLLEGAHPNLIVVLLSTIALSEVQKISDLCSNAKVGFLDCGVTPGNRASENGIVAIVGGDHTVFQQALPVLEDWAKTVVHCGPVGSGMATKIARNLVTFGSWCTVAEAAKLVEAAGVKASKLTEVIEAADPGGETLLQLLKHRDENGVFPEQVVQTIEPLMIKDLKAARDLASTLKVEAPLVDLALRNAPETLGLVKEKNPLPKDSLERGKEIMTRVYGKSFIQSTTVNLPFINETVNHLFADIWSRPELSIRDRRLLVIGATAALGRADLLQVQLTGALKNKEMTIEQLQEVVLQLAYYVGWGNATTVQQAVNDSIQSFNVNKNDIPE